MKLTIPGMLTFLRIALVPVFVVLFLSHLPLLATIVFAIAALTDYFDGLLARLWHQTSAFGAFLDPVADKLLVSVSLVMIVSQQHSALPEFVLAVPAAIIIARELAVSALREWMAEIGSRASVAVNIIGKCKAVLQMIAIGVLVFSANIDDRFPLLILGTILLYIATVLTVWSMVMYLQVAWKDLRKEFV
jgi:CDP-diacylglycerol--glycerol-3-phosphate 3-phosphatidyltransferase